jgi:hypothetical protein
MCANMVPTNWNDGQKTGQKEVSADMLERLETELNFLNWGVRRNESWLFNTALETRDRVRNDTPQSPRQKEALLSESTARKIVIILSILAA